MRRFFRYFLIALGLVFVLAVCAPVWPKEIVVCEIRVYPVKVSDGSRPDYGHKEWATVWDAWLWESDLFD